MSNRPRTTHIHKRSHYPLISKAKHNSLTRGELYYLITRDIKFTAGCLVCAFTPRVWMNELHVKCSARRDQRVLEQHLRIAEEMIQYRATFRKVETMM